MNNTGLQAPSRATGNVAGHQVWNRQNFTPEQMQLFQRMFQQVSPQSYTSRLASGDQDIFNEIEAPALKQFSGFQGNIASRFSQPGLGARHSSGFQNAMNTYAQDFASQLQANRQNLQRQALSDLMSMSNNILNQRPQEQFFVPKQKEPSFLQRLLGTLGAGAAGGLSVGLGGGLANMLGSLFSPNQQQSQWTDEFR